MADYRVFPLGLDGHFVGFEPLVCDSDKDAVQKAKSLCNGRAVELWCGSRLVVRIEAFD
jgi:hypothetical protein